MNINAREFRPTSRASAPVTPARGSTPAPASGTAPLQAGLDRKASGAGHLEGEPACPPSGLRSRVESQLLAAFCRLKQRLWSARALGTRHAYLPGDKWQAPQYIQGPDIPLQQLLSVLLAGV